MIFVCFQGCLFVSEILVIRVSTHSLLTSSVLHNPLHLGIMSSENYQKFQLREFPETRIIFYGIHFSSVFVAFDKFENIKFIMRILNIRVIIQSHGAHLMGGHWPNADIRVSEVSTELN